MSRGPLRQCQHCGKRHYANSTAARECGMKSQRSQKNDDVVSSVTSEFSEVKENTEGDYNQEWSRAMDTMVKEYGDDVVTMSYIDEDHAHMRFGGDGQDDYQYSLTIDDDTLFFHQGADSEEEVIVKSRRWSDDHITTDREMNEEFNRVAGLIANKVRRDQELENSRHPEIAEVLNKHYAPMIGKLSLSDPDKAVVEIRSSNGSRSTTIELHDSHGKYKQEKDESIIIMRYSEGDEQAYTVKKKDAAQVVSEAVDRSCRTEDAIRQASISDDDFDDDFDYTQPTGWVDYHVKNNSPGKGSKKWYAF